MPTVREPLTPQQLQTARAWFERQPHTVVDKISDILIAEDDTTTDKGEFFERLYNLCLDFNFIEDQLCNNEVSDDDELIAHLYGETKQDWTFISRVVNEERSKCLRDVSYDIDWTLYLP